MEHTTVKYGGKKGKPNAVNFKKSSPLTNMLRGAVLF